MRPSARIGWPARTSPTSGTETVGDSPRSWIERFFPESRRMRFSVSSLSSQ
jgi:hypothetical protein